MELQTSSVRNCLDDLWTSIIAVTQLREMLIREISSPGRRMDAVEEWVNRVEELERYASAIFEEESQQLDRSCLGGFSPNYWLGSYIFRKKVMNTSAQVDDLCSEGRSLIEDLRIKPPRVDVLPEDDTVGMEANIHTVLSYLQQDDVVIVGLYGMTGAGKTALLTKINYHFSETGSSDYDIVIGVVVSREISMERIQRDVGERLGLVFPETETLISRAQKLSSVLSFKRFLLLLDDIWERIDFSSVGIPLTDSRKGSKVVLTTRSEDVCRLMKADRVIRVEPLNFEDALTLFYRKVGGEILSTPEICEFAESIAQICEGQPLALIVIGRAMASKRTPEEWRHAVATLKERPWEFPGIERVFFAIKLTYDDLPIDSFRSCFLFCCLYPLYNEIHVERLIEQWIGQGYMDLFFTYHEAVALGRSVVETLVSNFLLESGGKGLYVKMNFWARALGLWISNGSWSSDEKLVKTGKAIVRPPQAWKWSSAEAISLTDTRITELDDVYECPRLLTLLLFENLHLSHIHDDFFLGMPLLQFLDLSDTGITKLPASIGKLVHLEYLDISTTMVAELPSEMKKLIKLRYFFLNHHIINAGEIATHLNLLVLKRR